ITSSIFEPRKDLADCSPRTQRTASMILLFPLPFGPTIAVTPGTNSKSILSAKDLKPILSKRFKNIGHSPIFIAIVLKSVTLGFRMLLFYHRYNDIRNEYHTKVYIERGIL